MCKSYAYPWIVLLVSLLLSACVSKDSQLRMLDTDIVARPDANLDDQQQPSPVVIRLYQLTDAQAFQSASFEVFSSGEFSKQSEWVLYSKKLYISPGRLKTISFEIEEGAKYLGVVAGLRNAEGGSWREVAELPEKKIKRHKADVLVQDREVTLTISRN